MVVSGRIQGSLSLVQDVERRRITNVVWATIRTIKSSYMHERWGVAFHR